jgi:hypothetical protein
MHSRRRGRREDGTAFRGWWEEASCYKAVREEEEAVVRGASCRGEGGEGAAAAVSTMM